MNNPTDTNQASEDELDAILNRIISQETSREGGWAGYISDEKEYVESVPYGNELHNQQELKQALQDLIRTEKLKLLDRLSSHQEDLFWWTGGEYEKTKAVDMRAIAAERELLTKLEAEL